jgi:hypothetical protein
MLNRDDKKAPGKKAEPSNVKVFMEVLSRRLISARRRCWKAISRLSLDSL